MFHSPSKPGFLQVLRDSREANSLGVDLILSSRRAGNAHAFVRDDEIRNAA